MRDLVLREKISHSSRDIDVTQINAYFYEYFVSPIQTTEMTQIISKLKKQKNEIK